MEIPQKFLTELEVSQLTRLALSTLRNQRFHRIGIPYHKVGRAVRYSLRDVLEYMGSKRISTEDVVVDSFGRDEINPSCR